VKRGEKLLNWSFEGLNHYIELLWRESGLWIFQQRNFVYIIIKLLWLLQDVLKTGKKLEVLGVCVFGVTFWSCGNGFFREVFLGTGGGCLRVERF